MKTPRLMSPLVLCGLLLIIAGCGGGGGGGGDSATTTGTGTASSAALRVVVTDAPFSFSDVTSATVYIQKVEIHSSTPDAWQTLETFPGQGEKIDLVQLKNGAVTTLVEANPPPGTYDMVRLIVEPDAIVTGGTSYSFKVPSGPQTGVKINIENDITVVTSLTQDLVLDFDLSRSFVVQGNPSTPAGIKGFTFKPVVRAVNRSTAGDLALVVKSDNGTPSNAADDFALAEASCEVTDAGGAVVASGISDATGFVKILAIPAGTYTVTVTKTGYDPYENPSVAIFAANLTDLHTVTLAETLGAITGFVTTKLTPSEQADKTKYPDGMQFAVMDAAVSAGGKTTLTDSTGAYQLAGLPVIGNPYAVEIQAAGYAAPPNPTGTAWTGATPVDSNFELVPLTAQVNGTVRNTLNATVSNATVTAAVSYEGGLVAVAKTTSAANGTYSFNSLPTGSYKIDAGGVAVDLDVVGGGAAYDGINLTAP